MTRNARLPRTFNALIALGSIITLLCGPLLACAPEAETIEESAGYETDDADDDELRAMQLAETISADPLFASLLDATVEMTAQRAVAHTTSSDEDLQAFVVTVGHVNYSELIELDPFLEATGVQRQVIDQQLALTQQLIAKYKLGQMEPAQLESVFTAAASTDASRSHLEGAIENELRDITEPLDTQIDDCEAECILIYGVSAASALTTYIGILAAAAASGIFAPVIIAAGTASYFVSLALAESAKNDCMAVCNGEQPSGEECDKDTDCNGNEFCWKGVIGFGKNECRPEKPQGDTCARHGQCTSNCCKLHLPTNLISKTCRPANAC
ncbi:dickkopf-related protein [Enhygromyxa salina]|uniref:Dickkopf N-terminal cysteine-rich domain-containing protein n=1 Tax=Enhygromyxa salina TaxID=215803 RepID=A0A2S9YXD5_9BACT|nr:dickkopf-related protein [Enhygromyxa salina]PRQ09751.1 hypothetical protein ENSA7_05060 [Enhygromyxa salina]